MKQIGRFLLSSRSEYPPLSSRVVLSNRDEMHIAILRFEDCPPQQLPTRYLGAPILGYWIGFKADNVSGSALLVPAGSGVEEIRRHPSPQEIFVETDAKAYENFRLLEESEPQDDSFEPLPNPGDYEVIGEVIAVYQEDNGEVGSVRVVVGSCPFDLNSEYLNGVSVEEGTRVHFRVRELELFDMNL